jgi:hypothetical protein
MDAAAGVEHQQQRDERAQQQSQSCQCEKHSHVNLRLGDRRIIAYGEGAGLTFAAAC